MLAFVFLSILIVILLFASAIESTSLEGSSAVESKLCICVGDSITFGVGASEPSITSYPAVLSRVLEERGLNYTVLNYGVKSATLQKHNPISFWSTREYKASIQHRNADSVILLFGANDAKYQYGWNESVFISDYADLVQSYRAAGASRVFLMTPTVLLPWYASTKVNATLINGELPGLVRSLAARLGCGLVDAFGSLGGSGLTVTKHCIQYFVRDGLHPNDKGYEQIARAALDAVTAASP